MFLSNLPAVGEKKLRFLCTFHYKLSRDYRKRHGDGHEHGYVETNMDMNTDININKRTNMDTDMNTYMNTDTTWRWTRP
jgi:hypothetical protein